MSDEFAVRFQSPYEGHSLDFNFTLQVDCSEIEAEFKSGLLGCGDSNDGIYVATATLPKWSASGVWELDDMLWDKFGNQGTLPAFSVSFTNDAEIEDITPPVITTLSMTPSTFDSSLDDATITITMTVEDDVSGIYSGDMEIAPIMDDRSPIGSSGFTLISGDEFEGVYELTIEIPKDSYPGLWVVNTINLTDNQGNLLQISGHRNLSLAFPDLEIFLVNSALNEEFTIEQDWYFEGETLSIRNAQDNGILILLYK